MKQILVVGMIAMLALLSACSPQFLQTVGSDKYYVQILDEGSTYEEQGNIRYEYKLEAYDEDGEGLGMEFSANKSLKVDAYLRIYHKKDKVITYEEVDREEVPEEALNHIEGEDEEIQGNAV